MYEKIYLSVSTLYRDEPNDVVANYVLQAKSGATQASTGGSGGGQANHESQHSLDNAKEFWST